MSLLTIQRDSSASMDPCRFDVAFDDLARPQADPAWLPYAGLGGVLGPGRWRVVVLLGHWSCDRA